MGKGPKQRPKAKRSPLRSSPRLSRATRAVKARRPKRPPARSSRLNRASQAGGGSGSTTRAPGASGAEWSDAVPVLREAVRECASRLGMVLRPAELKDVSSIAPIHEQFDQEMARFKDSAMTEFTTLKDPAKGVRHTIETPGEALIVLTRELADCSPRGVTDICGFLYWRDDEVPNEDTKNIKGVGEILQGTSCYVAEVFVVTKERKQGLGELLMIAAQVEAIARGAHLSHLLVCDRNEGAVKLYKKLGFDTMFQSNDETHNLLMVNKSVNPEATGQMLAVCQAMKPRSRARRASAPLSTCRTPMKLETNANGRRNSRASTSTSRQPVKSESFCKKRAGNREELIDMQVKKHFQGHSYFHGRVIKVSKNGRCTVKYADGDTEELDTSEVLQLQVRTTSKKKPTAEPVPSSTASPWSDAEDKRLLKLIGKHGLKTPWSTLAQAYNSSTARRSVAARTDNSLRHRYNILQAQDPLKKLAPVQEAQQITASPTAAAAATRTAARNDVNQKEKQASSAAAGNFSQTDDVETCPKKSHHAAQTKPATGSRPWADEDTVCLKKLIRKHGEGDWTSKAEAFCAARGTTRSPDYLKKRWKHISSSRTDKRSCPVGSASNTKAPQNAVGGKIDYLGCEDCKVRFKTADLRFSQKYCKSLHKWFCSVCADKPGNAIEFNQPPPKNYNRMETRDHNLARKVLEEYLSKEAGSTGKDKYKINSEKKQKAMVKLVNDELERQGRKQVYSLARLQNFLKNSSYKATLLAEGRLPESWKRKSERSGPAPVQTFVVGQAATARYMSGTTRKKKAKHHGSPVSAASLVPHNWCDLAAGKKGKDIVEDSGNHNESSFKSCPQIQPMPAATETKEDREVACILRNNPEQATRICKTQHKLERSGATSELPGEIKNPNVLKLRAAAADKVAKTQMQMNIQDDKKLKQLKTPEALLLADQETLYKVWDSSLVRMHTPWQSYRSNTKDMADRQQNQEDPTSGKQQHCKIPRFTGLFEEYKKTNCRCKTDKQCNICRKANVPVSPAVLASISGMTKTSIADDADLASSLPCLAPESGLPILQPYSWNFTGIDYDTVTDAPLSLYPWQPEDDACLRKLVGSGPHADADAVDWKLTATLFNEARGTSPQDTDWLQQPRENKDDQAPIARTEKALRARWDQLQDQDKELVETGTKCSVCECTVAHVDLENVAWDAIDSISSTMESMTVAQSMESIEAMVYTNSLEKYGTLKKDDTYFEDGAFIDNTAGENGVADDSTVAAWENQMQGPQSAGDIATARAAEALLKELLFVEAHTDREESATTPWYTDTARGCWL